MERKEAHHVQKDAFVYGNFVRTSRMLSNLEISVKNAVQQTLTRVAIVCNV